jgi:hypothetical protein
VIRDNRVFFSFPIEEGYALLILSGDSREQRRGVIRVDSEELQYTAFNVSDEGILTALLATEYEARLVLWRTDRLAADISP